MATICPALILSPAFTFSLATTPEPAATTFKTPPVLTITPCPLIVEGSLPV